MTNEIWILHVAKTAPIERICDELNSERLGVDELRRVKKTSMSFMEDRDVCRLLGFNYRRLDDEDCIRIDYIALHVERDQFNVAKLWEEKTRSQDYNKITE